MYCFGNVVNLFFFFFLFLQYFPSFVPLCYFVHDKLNDDYDSGMFINI